MKRDIDDISPLLLESTDQGIYSIDIAGMCTVINSSALRMLGYRREEVVGRNMHALIHHTREGGAPYPVGECPIYRAFQTGDGCRVDDELFWRKDGTAFPVEFSSSPIRDSGVIRGAVISFTDITRLKRAEAALKDRIRDLAESERLLKLERESKASGALLKPGAGEAAAGQRAMAPADRTTTAPFPPRPGFWNRCAAWLVLLVSLLTCGGFWHLAREQTLQRARERFDFRVKTIEAMVRERLMDYEHALRSGTGLFRASDEVTRDEWRLYVQTMKIEQAYPGIQGLGFSQRVLPAEKDAHISRIRAGGFPQYVIRPEGERPEYTSIVYLEPFDWRNQRALGFDMFSEPVRNAAMARACDTGAASLSGKVTLVQETAKDAQAGFLMYFPVYRNGAPVATVAQRREALAGYVYAPFRMNDFMRGILADRNGYAELRIFDGGLNAAAALMYDGGAEVGPAAHADRTHFAAVQSTLEFGGHRWLLDFSSSQYFEEGIGTGKVNAILGLGILVSLLLSGVVWFMARSRGQAVVMAGMAADLERANVVLRKEVEIRLQTEAALERHATDLNAFNEAMVGRELRVIELKEEVNRLCAEAGTEPKYPPVWRKEP